VIYRLAFVRTKDGYLKVTASAIGIPTLTAIHSNPHVWAMAARRMDVCCKAIELDFDQLKNLGFVEDWRWLA
jgi:hypothetical protein